MLCYDKGNQHKGTAMKLTAFIPGIALLTMTALFSSVEAAAPGDVVGKWLTEGGKSHVQLTQQGSSLKGTLIWLKEPLRDGKPKTDLQNPNAALKTRPLIGLTLLQGFAFKSGQWQEGKIYNPEDGKEYSCTLTLKNADTLEVRGYVMNPVLGKTQTWKRVK
jgi:uncharacterized protein (DUF2147 family)